MSYTHLTPDERFKIAHMHMAKYGIRLIARRLSSNQGVRQLDFFLDH